MMLEDTESLSNNRARLSQDRALFLCVAKYKNLRI